MIRSSACAALLAAASARPPVSAADARIEILLDASEAEAALAILFRKTGGQPATEARG